jgi:hypothetical protein
MRKRARRNPRRSPPRAHSSRATSSASATAFSTILRGRAVETDRDAHGSPSPSGTLPVISASSPIETGRDRSSSTSAGQLRLPAPPPYSQPLAAFSAAVAHWLPSGASSSCTASRVTCGDRCAYRIVISIVACPSSSCTALSATPRITFAARPNRCLHCRACPGSRRERDGIGSA